ncbi:hypothetical protein, partial [Huaxiibacter chinensis]|uniref:hypothetical protein n=1 Tax=Huaxiibacter chinensis TaxID=2899785 RepID=UPI003F9DD95F
SDIRINSPPFYRLNYRGIGLEAYLSELKSFVKPDLSRLGSIAESVRSLLSFHTSFYGKYFAG